MLLERDRKRVGKWANHRIATSGYASVIILPLGSSYCGMRSRSARSNRRQISTLNWSSARRSIRSTIPHQHSGDSAVGNGAASGVTRHALPASPDSAITPRAQIARAKRPTGGRAHCITSGPHNRPEHRWRRGLSSTRETWARLPSSRSRLGCGRYGRWIATRSTRSCAGCGARGARRRSVRWRWRWIYDARNSTGNRRHSLAELPPSVRDRPAKFEQLRALPMGVRELFDGGATRQPRCWPGCRPNDVAVPGDGRTRRPGAAWSRRPRRRGRAATIAARHRYDVILCALLVNHDATLLRKIPATPISSRPSAISSAFSVVALPDASRTNRRSITRCQ